MERELPHAFVNRDALTELLEQLVLVRPRRRGRWLFRWLWRRRGWRCLPIVVAYGPGGAGKSALLTHLAQRWDGTVPLARVNVDRDGPDTSTEALLQRAYRELSGDRLADFGRLRMPRFRLARSILAARPEDTPNGASRRDADARAAGVSALLAATSVEGDLFRDIAVMFTKSAEGEPIRLALRSLPALRRSSITHSGRWWLRYLLFRPGKARLLGWFGELADRLDLPDAEPNAAQVLAHLWHRPAESEVEWVVVTSSLSVTAERILVAAFLADLAQAYRRRRRRRQVRCALLIDDADLLTPDDSLRLTFQGTAPAQNRPDVLGLLAEGRRLYPEGPLLVVATKQDAPPDDPTSRLLLAHAEPERAAAETYAGWRRRYDLRRPGTALLHVPLAPFDELGTARYVGVWASAQNRMTRTAERTAELHQVSRGHPRALWLLAEALVLRSDWASSVPAVRSLLNAPVPLAAEGLEVHETIAEAVLHGFLQRFVDDESGDRSQTRQWLRCLSAARFIDLQIIELLLDGVDARKFSTKLARYSMVTKQRSDRLVLHPLLRDLLQLDLLENAPAEYEDTHLALLSHFQSRAGNGEPVDDEVLYHHLALGDDKPLVQAVTSWISRRDRPPDWLHSIVDAPGRKAAEPAARPAGAAAPDMHATYLVSTLRRLMAPTSTERWTPEMLIDLDDAYRAAWAAQHLADSPDRQDHLLSRAVDHGALAPPAIPPASSRGHLAYPHHRLYRLRGKLATAGLLVVLAAAAATYVKVDTYWDQHCRRDSFRLSQQVWLATLGSDNLVLDRGTADQCVGLTDAYGSLSYSGREDTSAAGQKIDYLYRKITEENERILHEAAVPDPPKPVATIAVAAILTSRADASRRDLYSGLNELRGAYLAQWQWNHNADAQRSHWFYIRLVLSNFGQDAQGAAVSAQPLRNESDVLAVTGFGQTRETTITTANALRHGDGAVPIVASVLTGNVFSRMPGFLRVGPTNSRLAEQGMLFIKEGFSGYTPFVVFDGGDEYSRDLQSDYVRWLNASSLHFQPPVPEEFQHETAREDLDNTARRICESATLKRRPLVLYTGRANDLFTLLNGLDADHCLKQTVIVGDDDLTDMEADSFTDLKTIPSYPDQLYFTTFGPAEHEAGDVPDATAETMRFFERYNEIRKESHGQAYQPPPNGHVMLAYDAVNLVADAIIRCGYQQSGLPSRAQLLRQLQQTRGFEGAAGTITIAPNGVDPVDKLVVIQQVKRNPDRSLSLVNTWPTS